MKSITKASALKEYYSENGWRTQPYTITYIEDADADTWEAKTDKPDAWNDVRVLWIPAEDKIVMSATATSEPGIKMVENPMNSAGAFRIQLDKLFKECWEIDRHITKYSNQEALVQCDDISGFRDFNKDFKRTGDKLYTGLFCVDQHTTADNAEGDAPITVGGWSAGCLVGCYPSTHYNIFMPHCKGSGQKKFDTVVLDGTKFWNWLKEKSYSLV